MRPAPAISADDRGRPIFLPVLLPSPRDASQPFLLVRHDSSISSSCYGSLVTHIDDTLAPYKLQRDYFSMPSRYRLQFAVTFWDILHSGTQFSASFVTRHQPLQKFLRRVSHATFPLANVLAHVAAQFRFAASDLLYPATPLPESLPL